MKHDGKIDLATGLSAKSKIWKNKKVSWSRLVEKLSEEHKTTETLKEYLSATKDDQSKIKDVGGYVGGYLRNGRRKPENIVHRQVLTLDIDFAHDHFWDDFCMQFNNAAVLHATHKHTEKQPRFRLIIPLSRECTPDEYVAVSRKIAGILGIDLFDNTTFETNRLMFWPSNPKDVDYYFKVQDGPWVDSDKILDSYIDWTDSSLWPTSNSNFDEVKKNIQKQQDPETKKGVIGAFCRAYSIQETIEKYLSDVYRTTIDGRYTYVNGTAASGLIVYEDKFAYSHHGTDPCSGKLCNAFDLVRIHKFSNLDSSSRDNKSFSAMEELASKDPEVKKVIAGEKLSEAKYDFLEELEPTEEDIDWMKELEVDFRGKYLSSANNINLIFSNDKRLKKLLRQNRFDSKRYLFGSMPWRKIKEPEPVKNVDYSGIRNYIESLYGISGAIKIDDSLALEFERHSFHPVREYLETVEWDKQERVDEILIKYFGSDDNIYTREAIRKTLVGAVARIYRPGVKFDLVLTLVSRMQGTGKSSFFRALAKDWFSDSFAGVNGKEAFEQLQGSWIIEMAELKGLRKAEIESVKHFISKQEDMFRPAYARVPETFKRQCIFVATTNEQEFLRDPSGNRRFMPVDVRHVKLTENKRLKQFIQSKELIDQIWAESVYLYKKGEPLFLSKQAELIASKEQSQHSENDERRGVIEAYLDTPIADNWDDLDVFDRRQHFEDPISSKGSEERDFVCVAEIWCECLGREKKDMDRYKTREINDILRSLENWEQSKSTKNFKLYGKQKYYSRRLD